MDTATAADAAMFITELFFLSHLNSSIKTAVFTRFLSLKEDCVCFLQMAIPYVCLPDKILQRLKKTVDLKKQKTKTPPLLSVRRIRAALKILPAARLL